MYWQSEKNLLNSNTSCTRPHNMVNFPPTNGWDQFISLGHPSKFQQVSPLGIVTKQMSLNGGKPNFAQCLAVSWAGTLYIYIRAPVKIPLAGKSCQRNFDRCKIHFASKSCILLYWQLYCTALEQWASGKLCSVQQRAPPIFAITLGIGPHSSFFWGMLWLNVQVCWQDRCLVWATAAIMRVVSWWVSAAKTKKASQKCPTFDFL